MSCDYTFDVAVTASWPQLVYFGMFREDPEAWGDLTLAYGHGIESWDYYLWKVKDSFDPSETVYVFGEYYALATRYDTYVVSDVGTWTDGMTIPARIPGTATYVRSDEEGPYIVDPVWEPPLTPGKYDIVVDVNGNGKYDASIDALDDLDIGTAGFFVIPEYWLGTILGLAGCFAAFGVFRASKRKQPSGI